MTHATQRETTRPEKDKSPERWAPGSIEPLVLVGDTGIEPVTSSVSGKRAPAAPIARADDGTRTRDHHLGKVMLYQLSHVRMLSSGPLRSFRTLSFLLGDEKEL